MREMKTQWKEAMEWGSRDAPFEARTPRTEGPTLYTACGADRLHLCPLSSTGSQW